ncbi:MAG TPA: type II toxin-antitoxin system RelE/ParE family toxin [Burkholderiales bacterium]
MIDVRWHRAARAEAAAAAAFYRSKRPGLAQHLLQNLEEALRKLQRRPRAYPRVEANVYKCRVPHFPYGILYRVREADFEEPRIEILALMHLRRAPTGGRSE